MKHKGETVAQYIIDHKHAYEELGIEPVSVRLTCAEHKALFEYSKHALPKDIQPSIIKYYYGVEIEIVVIVEPYL